MAKDIEKHFDEAMFDIYRRAKSEARYNATIFLKMLTDNGGVPTAKYLINTPQPSDGYTHLYERGRLDLTVEAMVVENPKWHELFTDEELDKARTRLGIVWLQAHLLIMSCFMALHDHAASNTSRLPRA